MNVPFDSSTEPGEASGPSRHLVVGIGTSGGGIRALRTLLADLPATTGMAFVLILHLGPGEDDIPIEALRSVSALPVSLAVDGASVAQNHLHVAPPGTVMKLRRGRFVVRPARGSVERRTAVDRFFRSLAEDVGPCAVGILLSNSGTDGPLGLASIGASGGLTIAQLSETPDQGEVPGSAAATGACDHVLPPEEIARTLLGYAAHLHYLPEGADAAARHRAIFAALPQVSDVLKRVTGNDFRHYKATTLVRRIERRMQVLQVAEATDYLDRLDRDESEARTLFRELLIGVTSFFRDPDAFEALAARALAPLLAGRSATDELRIWIPGCATGEEAYSIAMLVREAADRLEHAPRIQIFATDINERALATARRGSYPQGIAAQISAERLARFFVKKGRRYHVLPELREMCLFTPHNLVSDPPFSRLDLVSCRNLLIYLSPHLQKKLFPVFHYALKPGGYLFLGSSESFAGHGELFRPIDPKSRLAQRKDARGTAPGGLRDFGGQGLPGLRSPDQMAEPDLGAIAQRILLTEFAPRYAIVSDQGQVVHLAEGVDKFLQPPVGNFANSVTRMARRGLSAGLRSAFAESVRRRRTVVHEFPAVQTAEGLARVRLTVQPMPELGHGEGLYLLVFEDLGSATRTSGDSGSASPDSEAAIESLERELTRAREEIERAAQDQEAANEELKSSNEELLSMNEELQSANEELEVSKEDVQAANRSLEQANADLENLLRSTLIATVFLDRAGLIRTFTPAAAEIYNLRPADIGRPLEELRTRLRDLPDVPSFDRIAREPGPLEHVALHLDGRWFLRRVLPYRGSDGAADGVLVTFVDITTQKQAEEALRAALEFNRRLLDSSSDGIKVLSLDGRLEAMSTGGLRAREVEDFGTLRGTSWLGFWTGEAREAAAAALEQARRGGTGRFQGASPTVKGRARFWDVVVTPILDGEGRPEKLLEISRDITDQRRAEESLRDAAAVVENMDEGFLVMDAGFGVKQINAEGLRIDGRPADQILGRPLLEVWPRVEDMPTWPLFQGAMAERRPAELVYRHVSGERDLWLEVRAYPVGQDLAIFYRDVTDRESAREAQRTSEERLRETSRRLDAVLNNTTMAVFVMDEHQHCTYANAAAEQLTGYSLAEMQGRPLHDVVHHTRPDGRPYPLDECPIDRAFPENAQTQGEEVFVHKDGHFYPVAFTASPIRDDSSRTVGTIIEARDIAHERAARAALAESEAKFRTIANAMPQMVWSTRPDGYHDFYNDRWYEFTGVPYGSTDGEGWNDMFHPEDQERARGRWENSLATGEPYEIEYRLRHRSGAWRWVLGRALPVLDEAGHILRWMGTCTDIEDQKRIEAELAEALAIKDVLLHEVNHRVKNSLQLVTSLLMLQAGQAKDATLRQALMEARGRLSVVASMHQRLYSTSQHDRVDFGEYLREMATETLRALDAEGRITLQAELAPDLVLALTQAVPLALAISELVTNAVKYAFIGRDRGCLKVALHRIPGGARIEVADDGVGLPEGFDPMKSGSLGMKIVTSLVRQVRARLTIERSYPGCRFVVDLPLVQEG